MTQESPIPRDWLELVATMKSFSSAADLAEHYPPDHRVQQGGMEIWHYPLGVAGGTRYSIHVALAGEDAPQVYMHMVPTGEPDTVRDQRPWWRRFLEGFRRGLF